MSASFTGVRREGRFTDVSASSATVGSLVAPEAVVGPQTLLVSTPQTATSTATLTAAQMFGSILVGTPTAAATYTTLTGPLIADAYITRWGSLVAGAAFDLIIINTAATDTYSITLAAGSSVTITGSAIMRPSADLLGGSCSGTFRFVCTSATDGAETFTAYRIA